MIIDGKGATLGRLASEVAGLARRGKLVDVVNANEVVINGNKPQIIARYQHRRALTCRVNPDRGGKFPRTPEGIVKRAIRGMIAYKTPAGRNAFKRVKVYRDIPSDLSSVKKKSLGVNKVFLKSISIKEVSNSLGYKY
ncbi:MAG: 50S ribosomal protein L13 [Candidatus Diapherotrites archaeon]|nr:50S ribosomal protein L13 [Candidatus Diapherotrites archaeon]